jgi:hypothetical protein
MGDSIGEDVGSSFKGSKETSVTPSKKPLEEERYQEQVQYRQSTAVTVQAVVEHCCRTADAGTNIVGSSWSTVPSISK